MGAPNQNQPETMTASANDAELVTLGANWTPTSVSSQKFARALYVGTTGNVKVDLAGIPGGATGQTGILFSNVPAGFILSACVTKVYSTSNGTTASNIVALY
jgi:hypothetical protein